MGKSRRIGILGGTFDPPHVTHREMARAARKALDLERVLFVVAAHPPHKTEGPYATGEERLAMVRAALDGERHMESCALELEREGPSYTYDTLRELRHIEPDAAFHLIVGFDMLVDFPRWRNPQGILEIACLAVVPRAEMGGTIPPELAPYCDLVPFEKSAVSSTELRQRAAAGEPFDELVPQGVADLIRRRGIYQTSIAVRETARAREFIELLYERLPDMTRRHSLGAAEMMHALADKLGLRPESAVAAGLLHDFGKRLSRGELIEAAQRYGLALTDIQREIPKLLHASVGAEECRHVFGIDDPDVYEAVFWHTTGRPNLCTLGLALYVADFSEPARTFPEAAIARDILEKKGFHESLLYVSKEKLARLHRKNAAFDPETEAFYAWLSTCIRNYDDVSLGVPSTKYLTAQSPLESASQSPLEGGAGGCKSNE